MKLAFDAMFINEDKTFSTLLKKTFRGYLC
jgi:hypothetical protein